MYSKFFIDTALEILAECDGVYDKAVEKLEGLVSCETLKQWEKGLFERPPKHLGPLTSLEKRSITLQRALGKRVAELAEDFGVTTPTIYNVLKKNPLEEDLWVPDWEEVQVKSSKSADELPDDIDQLKRRCIELEMDNAILAQTIEILKKDPGVDCQALTNQEKSLIVDALCPRFSKARLCERLAIPRSSYYYAKGARAQADRYRALRLRIRKIFEESRQTFGSERIWQALRAGDDGKVPVRVSEKVLRRLMKEEGLAPIFCKKKRRYSSYKGEISQHPGNLVHRRFKADKPNQLWLTDITQFSLPGFKCYFSVIVDCLDGQVVAAQLGGSPDAELANATLEAALKRLKPGEHPVLHSDCGCHYRWPGWIERCQKAGIVRSMSKKGCSPDNAACEGFFGRLKNEFFYYRNWAGVSFNEFVDQLSEYIIYYNCHRKKKSLGWKSPVEYRMSLGYAI